MPVYLTTGTPGAGKSLRTIWVVERRRKAENREVYYYNIKGLTLDGWHELTLEQVMRWWELPHGSIIVIDEAQDIFPKGSASQRPPEHADRVAKHRHGGFDIYLVTQHPMKLDANVRKDVETHEHLMRKFMMPWSTVHAWKGVRDNCDKTRKDSLTSQFRFPAEAYGWYTSAEVHTVQRSIPWKVWFGVVVLPAIIGGLSWYIFYGREMLRAPAVPVPGAATPVDEPGGKPGRRAEGKISRSRSDAAPVTASELAASYRPRIVGMPHTAPRYDEITAPVRAPVVVGCWQTETRGDGFCITQQGTRIRLPEAVATAFIENGGQFVDFDAGPPVENEAGNGGGGSRQWRGRSSRQRDDGGLPRAAGG